MNSAVFSVCFFLSHSDVAHALKRMQEVKFKSRRSQRGSPLGRPQVCWRLTHLLAVSHSHTAASPQRWSGQTALLQLNPG